MPPGGSMGLISVWQILIGEKSIDVREYIDCSLARPACLVLIEKYVVSHPLAVTPQSGTKYKFYCTVYYIT